MFPITGRSHYEANRENFDFASVTFFVIPGLCLVFVNTLKTLPPQYLFILPVSLTESVCMVVKCSDEKLISEN